MFGRAAPRVEHLRFIAYRRESAAGARRLAAALAGAAPPLFAG